jgi:lysophospholipase L1-like esterase
MPSDASRSIATVIKIVGLSVVPALVFFSLLELGSRWIRPVPLPEPLVAQKFAGWAEGRVYDPLLFWRMRPNIERNGEMFTNSLGLRGPEIPDRTAEQFRVLSLGESTTISGRLRFEDIYSSRLVEPISAMLGRPAVVLNGGVTAYTIAQGFTYLEHRGLDLEPDAVLIYFGYNDFLPIVTRVKRDAAADAEALAHTDRQMLGQRSSLLHRISGALVVHSNLYRSIVFRNPLSEADLAVLPAKRQRVPREDRLHYLASFEELCRERGIVLIIIVPWYREFAKHVPLLREFAAERGVPLVDLPRRLQHLTPRRSSYFLDALHPHAEGHRLIAGEIVRVLADHWGVDGVTPPVRDAARRPN